MIVQLANILLRQAQKQQNPRQYLDDLISTQLASLAAQGGIITSTTVNGKSVTLQSLPGANLRDQMAAADLALSALESGLSIVPRQTLTVLR
jgi:hypothetical protein